METSSKSQGRRLGSSVSLWHCGGRCNLSHCPSKRQIDFKYKTYRSVHPLFGRRALSGKELSGGAPDVLRVKTRCNLSRCRSKRQIDFKYQTYSSVHPLFGRRALSGKELSGGAPDILRVKTRSNLFHCRSRRSDEYNTYRSVHALFGRRAWCSDSKTRLKLSVSADQSANEILDDRTTVIYITGQTRQCN